MKKIILLLLFLQGCSTFTSHDNFAYKEIQTGTFKISSWQKMTNPNSDVRVYIEDGDYAFNSEGQASSSPMPKDDFTRKLAFNDQNDNVIYLANPCRYIADPKCEEKYRTTARFSPEIIMAMGEAIIQLTRQPIVLIGYSSGGQIVGQIALKKWDGKIRVKKIITIAGILDHQAWTTYHNIPPLKESLNLGDYKTAFNHWPQIHYVGEKDTIVPPELTQRFVKDKSLIIIIPDASHNKGWDTIYSRIYK